MVSRKSPRLLSEVVAAGDLRVSLEAVRDLLAVRLSAATPGESAALARQLESVLKTIAGLPRVEKSSLDDLAGRRAKRRTAVQKRAGKPVERGSGGG